MPHHRLTTAVLFAAVTALTLRCYAKVNAPASAEAIAISAGNGQSGVIGQALGQPLVVAVTNGSGGAVAGASVQWTAPSGGGSLTPAMSLTDAAGKASATWSLGGTIGAQTARASLGALAPVTFTATATSSATAVVRISGDNQTGPVNASLPAALTVKVENAAGAGVPGVVVQWVVTAGGGLVSAPSSLTNGSGHASITWTLGGLVGAQTARAGAGTLPPVTFGATATAVANVQRFISPAGNDANDGQSVGTPWRTFARAFGATGIQGGQELVLLDGTYGAAQGTGYISSTGTNATQIPSGPSTSQPTWVHALTPGQVTVIGELVVGTKTRKDSNIVIQGITFEGGGGLYNTSHVVIRECGFHSTAEDGGAVFGIGTNDHTMGNSYNLIEDSWIWGRNRNIAINYRSDHNIWRRVLIRGDGCSSSECAGNGNPNFGLSVYDATYTSVQNVIVVDRILDGGSEYADFGTAQHTAGMPYGGHEWLGTIALNGPDQAYYFEADASTIFPTHTVRNCVGWNSWGGFQAAASGSNDLQNCTLLANGGDGIRMGSNLSTTGAVIRNHIVFGSGNKGVVSEVDYSFVNVTGSWANGAFATSCDSGCRTINPLTGTPPSLRHPTRIEDGSALKGTGQGGADYGATVVNRYGADGSLWGDPGYNALTTIPLWPYPNQARIKAQLCAGGVTRGFCGTSQTLTEYIWGQLGNPLPPGVLPGR